MTLLLSSLTNKIISPLSSTLFPSQELIPLLVIPATDPLIHVTAFEGEDGKKKDELVTVDINDFVSSWLGITDTNYNADQFTVSRQPLYSLSAINNHPALNFDGLDNLLNFGSLEVDFNPSLDNFTIFMVVKFNSNSNNKTVLSHSGNFESYMRSQDDITWRSSLGSGGSIIGSSFTNNPTILTVQYDGTNVILFTNGVQANSVVKTPLSKITDLIIGAINDVGSFPADGFIGEIALYKRSLLSQELTDNHEYFSEKWGINLVI